MIKEYKLNNGETRYMFKGYYGINKRTGRKIITTKRGFKTEKQAKIAEARFIVDLEKAQNINVSKIKFGQFYSEKWLPAYKLGQTTSVKSLPTEATVFMTENLFKHHILPLFEDMTISFINNNKHIVADLLTKKSLEYANFKALRGYFLSVIDWAEELDIISYNNLTKSLRRIKSVRKIELAKTRNESGLYLNEQQLSLWLSTFELDYKNKNVSTMDYTLFLTTLFLSDRKSETYALQWKHIDFDNNQIHIVQALDRFGKVKSTKGNKKTIFNVSDDFISLLKEWKKEQMILLQKFNIFPSSDQYVFTYMNNKGEINVPLYIDYLNAVMKSHRKRHSELAYATPHTLRHTGATLAKKAGLSIEQISEALTHSDTAVTKTYVNTTNIIPIAVGDMIVNSSKG